MKQFKIGCSSIGKIMSAKVGITDLQANKLSELQKKSSRTADEQKELDFLIQKRLPKGAKTYCDQWLKQQIYARRKEFSNKYTEKGDIGEYESLQQISEYLGVNAEKNDTFFDNEWMHGFPDSIVEDYGIDAKTPWDCFTFPLFDTELQDEDYYWQGQGYMSLTGKQLWKIAYVLVDTPEHLIKNEARSWCFKNGEQLSPEIMEDFRLKMTYSNIPLNHKIKVFDVVRSESDINAIIERVKMCREYIEQKLQST